MSIHTLRSLTTTNSQGWGCINRNFGSEPTNLIYLDEATRRFRWVEVRGGIEIEIESGDVEEGRAEENFLRLYPTPLIRDLVIHVIIRKKSHVDRPIWFHCDLNPIPVAGGGRVAQA